MLMFANDMDISMKQERLFTNYTQIFYWRLIDSFVFANEIDSDIVIRITTFA